MSKLFNFGDPDYLKSIIFFFFQEGDQDSVGLYLQRHFIMNAVMQTPKLKTRYQKRRTYQPFRINDLVLIRKEEDNIGRGPSGLWFPYYGPYIVRSFDDKCVQVEDIKTDALLTLKFPYGRVSLYQDQPHFPGHCVVQMFQKNVVCPFKFSCRKYKRIISSNLLANMNTKMKSGHHCSETFAE